MIVLNVSGQIGRVPVAVDDAFQTQEDTPLTANVATNDIRGDGTQIWTLISTVSYGILKFNPSGTFTYEPGFNYYGTDSFVYSLCDKDNECSQATVTIAIISVNDPPVLAAIGNRSVCQGSMLSFSVTASDPDIPANTLSFSLIGAPSGAVIDASTGGFTWTPDVTQSGVFTFTVRVTDDGAPQLYDEEQISITVYGTPSPAGAITGPATFSPGTSGVSYNVAQIPGATSYVWTYSGTGVVINGNGSSSVTLDFSMSATGGQLSVTGHNECFDGISSYIVLAPASKTLNISSLLLESLYSGSGTMRQAWNATGPQWPAGVADHITVELRSSASYSTIIYDTNDVELNTSGEATVSIPSAYRDSYFITIKHRNSIEITTPTPVSFAGSSVSQSFGSTANVYGNNLKLSADNRYLIYGGDANQDGSVDTGDYTPVVNAVSQYVRGYVAADVDGNGSVDTGDYSILVNNVSRYIRTYHP